jgi:integrase/recombinase XerD
MTLLQYLQQKHPPATVRSYEREISIYLNQHPQAAGYTYKEVMQYVGELRGKYSNPRNIGRIVQAIKKYYHYLHYTGQRSDNPAKAIRLRDNKNKPIQLQDLFTAEELQALLAPRQERYPFLAGRNKVIMSLLVNQGLKAGELVQLETKHINLEEATIFIPGTAKTNKRTLTLKAGQIMLLQAYINQERTLLTTARTGSSDKLLLSKLGTPISTAEVHYIVSTYGHLYPARQLTPQAIRQSAIMNLLSAGNDIRLVQVFAGHKRPSATEQYKQAHIETLKMEIQKHHPLG